MTSLPTTAPAPAPAPTVDALITSVLAGAHGPSPSELVATSVFWIHHGTRLAGGDTTYLNQYVLVRLGGAFGGCAFEAGEIDPAICRDASGTRLDVLLREAPARYGSPPSTRTWPGNSRTATPEPSRSSSPPAPPRYAPGPGTRPSPGCWTSPRAPGSASSGW